MMPVLAAASTANPAPVPPMSLDDVLGPYTWVFIVAFAGTILSTPMMRFIAIRGGIVDWPDLKRKSHIEPVAYLGGVAIFLGWAMGLFMCLSLVPHYARIPDFALLTHIRFPLSLFVGAAIVLIVGLFDDVYGVSPRVKIGGQLLAAAALSFSELNLGTKLVHQSLIALNIEAPAMVSYCLGTVFIALLVLGGCNAMNLLDGLDGLAAGVSAISCVGFLFIAVFTAMLHLQSEEVATGAVGTMHSDPVRLLMCLALLGALLGFLPYNFNPANIFMGDAGSLLLGYLCSTLILLFADVQVVGPKLVMAAVIVFALPISDTSLAIFRRLLRGQPIFSADNQHMHHVLVRAGLSVRRAVLTLYGLSAFFALMGCLLVFIPWRFVIAVFLVIFGFVLVTAYKIGHRQMLRQKLAMSQHAPSVPPVAIKPPTATRPETLPLPASRSA